MTSVVTRQETSDTSTDVDLSGTDQPLLQWRLMSEAFRRWTRYDGYETSDDSSASDNAGDEQSATGSVQGLLFVFAAWRAVTDNVGTLTRAFDRWKWCTRTAGLSDEESETANDTDGNSGYDQDSDDNDSGDDYFPEPVQDKPIRSGVLVQSDGLQEFSATWEIKMQFSRQQLHVSDAA